MSFSNLTLFASAAYKPAASVFQVNLGGEKWFGAHFVLLPLDASSVQLGGIDA